jgi:hypothetical protein
VQVKQTVISIMNNIKEEKDTGHCMNGGREGEREMEEIYEEQKKQTINE